MGILTRVRDVWQTSIQLKAMSVSDIALVSSRSHCLFSIYVDIINHGQTESIVTGMLLLLLLLLLCEIAD